MKQKNKLKTVLMIGIAFFLILLAKDVKAASLSISASKTSVAPGESVTITVSSDCTGRINLSTSGGSLSNNKVWVEGNSQSVTLTTSSAGTINVTATPETLSTSSGEEVNLGSKSCSIKVVANTGGTTNNNNNNNNNTNTKSSVATLANLGIKPNDFSGFTPSKKSYAVTVPNNVESIEVYASKGQSGQTISGTGTKSLKEGTNTFTITVTAEDKKTTNQYTITVTREAKEEEKPEEPEEQEEPNTEKPTQEKFGLSTLIVSGVSLDPNFSTDVFEYKVKLTEDKDKLDIKTVSTDEKAKIEVTGNENLQEGENIITILVTDESGEKTATYQIIVEKNLVDQEELAKQKEQEEKDKQMKMILIGGAGALLVIIAIIIIIMIKRKRNRQYAEEFSIPYAGLNQEEEEEKEDRITEEDSQIKSFDPMETEDKEKLRQEFLNQSFTEFEEEKPRKNRHSKGKRFK